MILIQPTEECRHPSIAITIGHGARCTECGYYAANAPDPANRVPCHRCDGTGGSGNILCWTCKGKGWH